MPRSQILICAIAATSTAKLRPCGSGLRTRFIRADYSPFSRHSHPHPTDPYALPLKELVRTAKLRWRIERDFQELKQELGLNHFEGRSWRGFHHHATLCIG